MFVSNVFCDPFLAHHGSRTEKLLTEIHRILDPAGVVILRETITPDYVNEIDTELLESIGLQPTAVKTLKDTEPNLWDKLEARYDGQRYSDIHKNSYYLFLAKP